MLKEYLLTAQDDLAAKREMVDVKNQRLTLAQDDFAQLSGTLAGLSLRAASSAVSLSSSTVSVASRASSLDPDLLRSDVGRAKHRVARLRRELDQVRSEVHQREQGLEALRRVEQQFCELPSGYSLDQAKAVLEELCNVQRSLGKGHRERADLLQCARRQCRSVCPQKLWRLKEELTRGSPEPLPRERPSTASQTDLSGELAPLGARLAELARTRLSYDEARREVQRIQRELADLEDRLSPGQAESDQDRLLLVREKEQLLHELRGRVGRCDSDALWEEIGRLERDLGDALECSNRAIADRLRLHDQKQQLLQQLRDATRLTACLETRMQSLSASTLSASSSSSLGSLSTGSSRGSLASLSFPDIYGGCVVLDVAALSRGRVPAPGTGEGPPPDPRCQRFLSVSLCCSSHGSSQSLDVGGCWRVAYRTDPPFPMTLARENVSAHAPTVEELPADNEVTFVLSQFVARLRSQRLWCKGVVEGLRPRGPEPPLSPICEQEGLRAGGVSAAVSDESVAGDSGVYEAAPPSSVSAKTSVLRAYERAIKALRKGRADNSSRTSRQRVVHARSKLVPSSRSCVRATVLPGGPECGWRSSPWLRLPRKGEEVAEEAEEEESLGKQELQLPGPVPATFLVSIFPALGEMRTYSLGSKRILSLTDGCVLTSQGCGQLPLCGLGPSAVWLRWLELRPPETASAARDESSDESTVISSRTSTLTRSPGRLLTRNWSYKCYAFIAALRRCDQGVVVRAPAPASPGEGVANEWTSRSVAEMRCRRDPADERGGRQSPSPLAEEEEAVSRCDKETNTECVFLPEGRRGRKGVAGDPAAALHGPPAPQVPVKRSQTFGPVGHRYVCRLNRSDSDSAMPLYRKSGPFQRNAMERRSLRCKKAGVQPPKRHNGGRTSLDLALDLQASQTSLQLLQQDLTRLREMKRRLEDTRARGETEVPAWLADDEQLRQVLAAADRQATRQTVEEKKTEKLLKKTSREIYRLRKSRKKQPDMAFFREKMAFLTRAQSSVPTLPPESEVTEPPTVDASATPATPRRYEYTVDPVFGVQV
ncbi:conserved hypothetical protein [Ixodes scapularis]|uniref:WWC1-like helical hairpin domain-containing protein n=1 Tax=Ixodes scapularis TaxID=6945 RepID=B7PJL5_IXOSC|nr:conserved hypothetical protein [Ixodes scapularis]|eukprot:XP_002408258.1 conserved hypothetical protein [Ixodes scapularis]